MLDLQSYDATFGACWLEESYDQLSLHHKKQNLQYLVNLFAVHPYRINNYDGKLSITCKDIAYDMFRMLKADGIMKISFNDLISKFEKSNFNIYAPFNKDIIKIIKMELKQLEKITFVEITNYEFSIPIRRLEELKFTNIGLTIKEIREMNKFYKNPDSIFIRMENYDSLLSSINGLFIQYKDEFENLYNSNIVKYNQDQIDKYRDFIELYMELSKIYHDKIDWYNKCSYQRLVDLGERARY